MLRLVVWFLYAAMLATDALGQLPETPTASFEVASIKRSAPLDSSHYGQMTRDPGRVNYSHVSLQNLLAQAFKIKNAQISGPDWLDSDRFDIDAKLPTGSDEKQIPVMLQALLFERFKLSFHKETKIAAAYELLIAKVGAKLKRTDEEIGNVTTSSGSGGKYLSGNVTMTLISRDSLANMVDRPVVDGTGIEEFIKVDLHWSDNPSPENGTQADDLPTRCLQLCKTR